MRDTKVDADAIHRQNGLNLSVCVRKAGAAVVGQFGKLRPIVNRPTAAKTMPGPRKSSAQRFVELKQELLKLEFFCKGTVLARTMKCGQPICACHADPAKRHGPYWEWTYKAGSKTVNVRLSPTAAPFYRAASQQYHKLKSLLNRLEKISHTALAAIAKQAGSKRKTTPKADRQRAQPS